MSRSYDWHKSGADSKAERTVCPIEAVMALNMNSIHFCCFRTNPNVYDSY